MRLFVIRTLIDSCVITRFPSTQILIFISFVSYLKCHWLSQNEISFLQKLLSGHKLEI